MSEPELLLAARRCAQCLTTRSRIVSGERAAELIRECRAEDKHFVCHKASAVGMVVHCRGVHEIMKSHGEESGAYQFARLFGIAIVEVGPDELDVRS